MNNLIFTRINKDLIILLFIVYLFFYNPFLHSQGFTILNETTTVSASAITGEKPQSKVWNYGGYWWAVIPVPASGGDPSGTYLYRLDEDNSWAKLIRLSTETLVKADVKSIGAISHILLIPSSVVSTPTAQLISIEFVNGSPPTYKPWTARPSVSTTTLEYFAETATIDIDGAGIMWLAYASVPTPVRLDDKDINVRWSGPPYSNWSLPFSINTTTTQVNEDDICVVTAFTDNSGPKIGVLWSDQNNKQFRFKYHIDGADSSTWSSLEIAASSAPGLVVADDHINFAVGSDGTIYAAVKTGYDSSPLTRIGLLRRQPSGPPWNLYQVAENFSSTAIGTRPIVLLNESENVVDVFFTEENNNNDLVYKESKLSPISFPPKYEYLTYRGTGYNNITSTKQNYNNEVVLLFSTGNTWSGLKAIRTPISTNNGAGYAFKFSGTSGEGIKIRSNLDQNSNTLQMNSGGFTIEAWFNSNNSSSYQSIFSRLSGTQGYDLSLNGGKIQFKINNTTVSSLSDYPIGTWTHVAATYVGTNYNIYINGISDISGSIGGSPASGTRDALIGAQEGFTNVFNGALDEVRVWNIARTQDSIRTAMSEKRSGSTPNLVGYWRFDVPQGLNVADLTTNNNYGTLYNIKDFRYIWSGAPVGDKSAFVYGGANPSVNLASSEGDDITVTGASGTINGIQLYRSDAPAMRGPIGNGLVSPSLPLSTSPFTYTDPLRYWGVKVIGSGSPTYDLVYNYDGHTGIGNESNLGLVSRNNLADNSWSDLGASLIPGQNTLTKLGFTLTNFASEFALASGSDPLPVELSTFTAKLINKNVLLSWRTETEVMNYGFDIERSNDGIAFNKIGFIEGNGNSNAPKIYSYSDNIDKLTGKLFYKLKQIDSDGSYSYSEVISVVIGLPVQYSLNQNYPNPFNPTTVISWQLPISSLVTIKVYDMLGNEVATLENDEKGAGYYEVNFDAKGLASGVYFYNISAGEFNLTKKMLLLR